MYNQPSVAGTLSESEIALTLKTADYFAQSANETIPTNNFVYFVGFDGTNNDATTIPEEQVTNVRQLLVQAQEASVFINEKYSVKKYVADYFPGPGSNGTVTNSSWLSSAVTEQAFITANQAYDSFCLAAGNWLSVNDFNNNISIALTSFSRGVDAAAIFSQLVYDKGIVVNGVQKVPPGVLHIDSAVIFDPVATGMNGNISFAPNTENMAILYAQNEYRYLFKSVDYSQQPGANSFYIYGNHCNIGGSYFDDALSAVTLEAATSYFRKSGVSISDVPPQRSLENNTKWVVYDEGVNSYGAQIWSTYARFRDFSGSRLIDNNIIVNPAKINKTTDVVVTNFTDCSGRESVLLEQDTSFGLHYDFSITDKENNTEQHYIYNETKSSKIFASALVSKDLSTNQITVIDYTQSINGHSFSSALNEQEAVTFAEEQLTRSFSAASGSVTLMADPLVLDLSGNGTPSLIRTSKTNFDLDANGFAENTSLAAPEDGFLARDLNGDGIIATGRELFGDQTVLRNGYLAAGAFQAIADLDLNGDGKVDSSDIAWSELRVWQDKNSDGITDSGELLSMAEAGVKAINTSFTTANTPDGNGNIVAQVGSFVRADGSAGAANGFLLKRDTTLSVATEHLDIPASFSGLPDIIGFGNMFDLQQAMVRNSSLASAVQTAKQVTEYSVLIQSFESILSKWAGVDTVTTGSRGSFVDAKHLAVVEKFYGQGFVGADGSVNPQSGAAVILEKAYADLRNSLFDQFSAQTILKPFWDAVTFSWDDSSQSLTPDFSAAKPVLDGMLATASTVNAVSMLETIGNSAKSFGLDTSVGYQTFTQTYAGSALGYDRALLAGIYGNQFVFNNASNPNATVTTTQLAATSGSALTGHWGDDVLLGQSGNDDLNGGPGNDFLDGGKGNDRLIGGLGADTYFFGRGYGQDLISNEGETIAGIDMLQLGTGIAPSDLTIVRSGYDLVISILGTTDKATVANYFNSNSVPISKILFADGTSWGAAQITANLMTLGTDNSDYIFGVGNQANIIHGLNGNDNIYGGSLADTLYGDAGNDYLDGTAGNDILIGGTGNDTLVGNTGSDTYIFNLGDGQDLINNAASDTNTAGVVDTLLFGAGVTSSMLDMTRVGNDLKIAIRGTTDTVTVFGHFYDSTRALTRIQFADGSTMDRNAMGLQAAYTGSESGDYMYGTGGASNRLLGMGGDDHLYGADKDDLLDGGAGSDYLDGGAGNDTLIGGAGNDVLIGGIGSDTYRLGRGDGQDTIYNTTADLTPGKMDQITYAGDIASDQLWFRRTGNDLEVSVIGSSDKAVVSSWFSSPSYHVQQFVAGDGKVLADAQVDQLVSAMAAFAPPAAGQTTLPQNYRDTLAPTLAANWK